MLGAMRKFSKSWLAIGLIGLLVIAFGVFGMQHVFSGPPPSNAVAKAGKREISLARYKTAFDNTRRQAEQRAQRPVTPEQAVAAGLDQQVLNDLVNRLAVSEAIDRIGVRIGKKQFEKTLPSNPAFYDRITGKFDPKVYAATLAENGLTPIEYQRLVTDDIAQEHVLGALGLGFVASRTHAAYQAVYAMQARDAAYLVVDPAKVERPAAPTEAQLQAYLQEVSAQVMRPELRQLTIVRFSSKAIAPTVQVTPEAVQQVFNFRKDQLTVIETRTVIHVPAKSPAMAATIAARLAKGEDPAAVAKSQGVDIVTYSAKPKSAIPDRKVADVAFSLSAGQTSGPIAGDLGQGVVKVVSISPGKTVTLDEVRPQMEQEARARAAEARVSELSDKFEAAISGGASVADAAKTVGLPTIVTPPVTAQGQSGQPMPVAGLSPKVLEAAFGLAQGTESELIQDEPGEYFVVHVNRVIAPALPTVDELRGPLTQNFVAREYERRVKARADQLAERIRKGESIQAVAAAIGARTGALTGVNQLNAQNEVAKVGRPLLLATLGAKANEVVVSPGPGGFYVAKVGAVRTGDVSAMGQMTNQAINPITGELQQEFQSRIPLAAREAVKLKVYPDNAKRAIGVSPSETSTGGDKGKAG